MYRYGLTLWSGGVTPYCPSLRSASGVVSLSTDQTIFRVASRHKPYAQLGNAMLRDKRMSLQARGGLAFILSFPSNWEFTLGWFCRDQGIGRDRARRIVKQHIAAGYCTRSQVRTAAGSWGPITYTFTDEPPTENPAAAKPAPVNPTPSKDCQSQRTKRDENEEERELHIMPSGTAGAPCDRLPFTADVLKAIASLGLDVKSLIERYQERTAGRRIVDPSAYVLRMARDEAAKQLGVPVAALASLESRDRAERASALAASVGAAAEPSEAVLRGVARRALLRGEKPSEIIAAWRASIRGLPVRNADRSLLAFADRRALSRSVSTITR
jgi:hypothetical protein